MCFRSASSAGDPSSAARTTRSPSIFCWAGEARKSRAAVAATTATSSTWRRIASVGSLDSSTQLPGMYSLPQSPERKPGRLDPLSTKHHVSNGNNSLKQKTMRTDHHYCCRRLRAGRSIHPRFSPLRDAHGPHINKTTSTHTVSIPFSPFRRDPTIFQFSLKHYLYDCRDHCFPTHTPYNTYYTVVPRARARTAPFFPLASRRPGDPSRTRLVQFFANAHLTSV